MLAIERKKQVECGARHPIVGNAAECFAAGGDALYLRMKRQKKGDRLFSHTTGAKIAQLEIYFAMINRGNSHAKNYVVQRIVTRANDPSKTQQAERRASKAKLVYINAPYCGIRRQRCGKGFVYRSPSGKPVTNSRIRQRIVALAIPPAWKDVIICPQSNGHIQAVGVDDAGRRQYIYHARWQAISSASKFDRMLRFGQLLPKIRRRVTKDLKQKQLTRQRVLAAVVRLLDKAHLRVGNQSYASQNGSHGATTLLSRHVEIDRARVRLDFPAKSGQQREVELVDAKVAKVVRQCDELDGQFLFQYLDQEGAAHSVNSTDVNQALRELSGETITAKDFRTWWGSVTALEALESISPDDSATQRKRQVSAAIAATAQELGNTKAVCRSSYIHPGLLAAASSGELTKLLARLPTQAKRELTIEETRFLALLPKLDFT